MADDITLSTNIGTGETLATDQAAGGEHYQQVKLVDGTADSTTEVQAGHGTAANALRVELPTDGTGQVKLAANTASIGTVGLNSGTNSIGKVGLNAGTEAIGSVKAAGAVAHDAVGTSILPVVGGAIAKATNGTPPGTAVAEDDVSYAKCDLDGRLFVNTSHPYAWDVNANTAVAETLTQLMGAPGAGLSLYIKQMMVSSLTAQTTTFISDSAGAQITEIPIIYTGANGSHFMIFDPPIRCAANTNLAYTTTAAVATSVMVTGYTAP